MRGFHLSCVRPLVCSLQKGGESRVAEVKASMGGTVWKILVKPGDVVEAGQDVVILESMKMEIPVTAESGGKVVEVCKGEGEFVQEEETLVRLEP